MGKGCVGLGSVLANAATEPPPSMSRNTNIIAAVLNKSSSSDLSRFDIDLMSKNTDNGEMKQQQYPDLTEASAPGGYQSHLVFQLTILLRLEVAVVR